jgi:hypothetical protein
MKGSGRVPLWLTAAWCAGLVCAGASPGLASDPPPITFAPAIPLLTGDAFPYGLAAADFNGDGWMDLALPTDLTEVGMLILLGRGDGTFETAPDSFGTAYGSTMEVGDFNRDGHPDLALADAYPVNRLFIGFGNGDGTFTIGPAYATDFAPQTLAAGDFNGDGRPDLLVGGFSFGMEVFLNLGSGVLGPGIEVEVDRTYPDWDWAGVVYRVADLDADGRDDIAVAGFEVWDFECTGSGFTFWKSLGAGSFSPTSLSGPACPYAVALVDWDRDNRRDVLVDGELRLGYYRNLGGSLFAPATYPSSGLNTSEILDADFNLDGVPDLALPRAYTIALKPVRQDGTPGPETSVPLVGRSSDALSADFDNDGLPDLAVAVTRSNDTDLNGLEVFLNRSVTPPPGIGEAATGAAPLLVTGFDPPGGDIAISYGPACGAADHSVVYGSLEPPNRGSYLGRICGLGTSGGAVFNPGPGSFFFVIVGGNGMVEGSYGRNSSGGERPESFAPATCDRPQVLSAACP